ncbi:MAG: helix-turn-helix transcriptional regulator [Myxococcales bacterium]|nr:helix-turn-helix transcriptional regulator [Myxococcales bacterium]
MPDPRDCHVRAPAAPTLWLAPTSALYAGPLLGVGTHRGAVVCLGEAMRATLTATTSSRHSTGPSAAILVEAGVSHRIDGDCDRALFLYLHPTDKLARRAANALEPLPSTSELRRAPRRVLASLLHVEHPARPIDARVKRLVEAMDAGEHLERSVAQIAARSSLSKSRFMHVFAESVGVPFRRYRLWARLRAATLSIARGAPLTTAALDAGFATPSHFSEAFRSMFGVVPSQLRAMTIVATRDTSASIEAALREVHSSPT